MHINKLYHRQCYRHHEQRASNVVVSDVGLQSADNRDDDMVDDIVSDNNKFASDSDVPKKNFSSSSVQAPLAASSLAASSLRSCELSAVVTPKPLADKQLIAVNGTAAEFTSQGSMAAVNVSAQETSALNEQKTNLSIAHQNDVRVSQPTTAAVNMEAVSAHKLTSVEVGVPPEEPVLGVPCSVGEDTARQLKTAVSDVSEQMQDKTDSERTEKMVPGKPAEALYAPSLESASSSFVTAAAAEHGVVATSKGTEQVQNKVESERTEKMVPGRLTEALGAPSLVSESISSSSFGTVTAAEHMIVSTSTTKEIMVSRQAPRPPRSCQQAPVDTTETIQQPTAHSHDVDISVSLSSDRQPRAAPLPCGTVTTSAHSVSNTTPTAAHTAVAPASSESSCKTIHHAVKDSRRLVARRPAPLPPTQTQQTTAVSQQPMPAIQITSVSTAAEVPIKSLQDVVSSDQQETNKHSLPPDVQGEHLSSKEAVSMQHEEQTSAVPMQGCGQGQSSPVPTPRHSRPPKPQVLSTNTEMCQASLSAPESAVVVKSATDKVAQPRKASPVPKPRKNLQSVVEPGEVSGEGKQDVMVKHGDVELLRGDASLTVKSIVKSKTDDIITDSCMSDAAAKEPGKQIPAARPRTPETMSVCSSLMPGEENNKSPSLSPAMPVKLPRSKKRSAAPLPPGPPRPVSPNVPSPKSSSTTEPEPQVRVPSQRPGPPVGMSSQVSNNSSDRSPTVNIEISSSTANSEPVRRKITPGVKFTFEKDVFRPPKSAGNVDTSSAEECLKPSRPAPPRPTVVAVTKRKVLHACSVYQHV